MFTVLIYNKNFEIASDCSSVYLFFSIMFAKFAIEEILPIVIANSICGLNLEFPRK